MIGRDRSTAAWALEAWTNPSRPIMMRLSGSVKLRCVSGLTLPDGCSVCGRCDSVFPAFDGLHVTHAPSQRSLVLRERMFYVRLRTLVKNRIVTAFNRYPEETAVLRRCADLSGTAGRKQLTALAVSPIDRLQIDRSVAFIDDRRKAPQASELLLRSARMHRLLRSARMHRHDNGQPPQRNFAPGRGRCRAMLTVPPVCVQLRKCRMHPGSYAWCQFRTSVDILPAGT